jgi:hypothetical protein
MPVCEPFTFKFINEKMLRNGSIKEKLAKMMFEKNEANGFSLRSLKQKMIISIFIHNAHK